MNLWEYFWIVIISFSIVSFTYMSAKVVSKGFEELKDMFKSLKQ